MCKCCDYIEGLKDIQKLIPLPPTIKEELEAQITSYHYRKGQKKPCGIVNYKSFKLNYCPMCGKKMKNE